MRMQRVQRQEQVQVQVVGQQRVRGQEQVQVMEQMPTRIRVLARAEAATPPNGTCSRTRLQAACSRAQCT